MRAILEGIFKGFIQWVYGLCLEIVQYIANSLLDVFQMDLNYFRQVAPVTDDILNIVIAVGWALLLGNLVFQATKSMATGLGFEGEDPKLLFTRTFVFGFLLLASQQICDIGLGVSSRVITLLQIPTSVAITIPDERNFSIGASWLLIIIVGFVIMWQFVKLCFEVAERYAVTAILVLMAPLAFGMGGSKNTEDIFKGWCRMFGSMCVMMVLNVVFLKLLISALGYMPNGVAVLPWTLLIVGIARVARKIDSIVVRMGLNPAITGDGLGRGLPGMVAYAVVRGIGSSIVKAAGTSTIAKGTNNRSPGNGASGPRTNPHTPNSPPPPPPGMGPAGPGAASGPASSGRQGGSAQAGFATRENAYAAQPQDAGHTSEAPAGEGRTGSGDAVRPEQGAGRSAVFHMQGSRRSSVPPEARGGSPTGRTRTASRVDSAGRETTPSAGSNAGGEAAAAGTSPQRPPLHRPHNPAQPGQPGAPATGGPRISAVTAGRGQEISSERTSYIETHQADLERTSLQRDQTSKIPAPPGVGSRKGEPPASSAAGMRTPAGNSTPQANAAAPQTFAGERQTRRSQISNPGGPLYGVTGGTRQGGPPAPGMTGTVTRSGSGTPSGGTKTSGGTAGTHTAYRDKHTRSRSINTLADTAGIGTSPGQTTRPGHNAPIPGTAGTAPHRSHEQPLAGSAAPSSATAETRRSSGDRPPKARGSIPTFAMAETVPADGAKAPEVNRGTRRLKPGVSAPPFAGWKGKPPQSRKKRGEP